MKCAHEYPQIPYCLFTGAGGATDLTPGQLSRQFKQGARLASSAIQVRPSKSKHLAWVQRQKTHATDEIARFRECVAAREFKESFAPFCHAYVSLAKKSVGISYTQLHNRSMSSFFRSLHDSQPASHVIPVHPFMHAPNEISSYAMYPQQPVSQIACQSAIKKSETNSASHPYNHAAIHSMICCSFPGIPISQA